MLKEESEGQEMNNLIAKRNKVCHNIEAEYSLVSTTGLKDQREWDSKVESEAKKAISDAFNIWTSLLDIGSKINMKLIPMSSNEKATWLIQYPKVF